MDEPCLSPDGAWAVEIGFGPRAIVLTQRTTGRQTAVETPSVACCDLVTWASPHRLFFADSERVFRLDPAKRKVRFVAAFDDFLVSPNGEWVAGRFEGYGVGTGVVSVRTGECVLVPEAEGFVSATSSRAGFIGNGAVIVTWLPNEFHQARISSLREACLSSYTTKP